LLISQSHRAWSCCACQTTDRQSIWCGVYMPNYAILPLPYRLTRCLLYGRDT